MGNRLSVIDRLMTVTRVRVNVLFAYYVYRPITTCGVEKRKNEYKHIYTYACIRTHICIYIYGFGFICMRITGSWACASERGRSGDSVNRFSVACVSNIQSMTDPVLSNMDVTTSRC